MRDNKPNKDWSRCVECGRFTGILTDGCEHCDSNETERVGGWGLNV